MNKSQVRHLNRGQARTAYFEDNAAGFPKDSPGEKVWTKMKAVIGDIQMLAAKQTSGAFSQYVDIKDDLFDKLKKLMRKMSRAADGIGEESEGFEELFRSPNGNAAEEIWLARGRAFHTNSAGHEAQFELYDLPPTFRDNLTALVTGIDGASANSASAKEQRGGATGALREKFRELGSLGRRADKIVRNKYEDDPEKIAAWEIASHLVTTQPKEEEETPSA